MRLLQILIFSTVFALAYSWVLVWILERREKVYGQGALSFSDAFLAGSVSLLFVYISNIMVLAMWPGKAASFNVLLVTALAGFCLYKESVYKLEAKKIEHRRRAEIRLLQIYIAKDPANAAYFGRLCRLYEKLGDKKQALEAARMVATLEPTERNRCRVKELQEGL